MSRPRPYTDLAIALASGAITAEAISDQYGEGVLGTVLGMVAGGAVASVAIPATRVAMELDPTGILKGTSNIVEDVAGEVFGGIASLF